jgi:hypothetical protein
VSDPRYFGIALTLDELHKILGLPEDVSLDHVSMVNQIHNGLMVALDLSSTSGRYDGNEGFRADWQSFFRPDIQTREVSQVVIHPLKEC